MPSQRGSQANDPGKERRFLIAAGTAHYRYLPDDAQLPTVEDDIRQMVELFTRKLGYKRVLPQLGTNPTWQRLQTTLSNWFAGPLRSPSDVVVLYYSGHGIVSQSNKHYLLAYNFNERNPLGTALLTSHLAWMLEGSKVQKLLVILDTCYAGRGTQNMSAIMGEVVNLIASKGSGFYAMASTLPKQEAEQGVFARTFVEAVSDPMLVGDYLPYIHPDTLIDYINQKLPPHQQASGSSSRTTASPIFIPNPHYQPNILQPRDVIQKRLERELRLKVMTSVHSDFIQNRLSSFVGRKSELNEIRQSIASLLLTGGYITITGQAGQGKSSIIAKLVHEYDSEKTAYHFIPLPAGPEHQVVLLRDLMAQLILKYELSDLYVSSENRAVLRDNFSKVLDDLVANGGKEIIIFIDGLDQLKEELDGERDLSFLPNNPPKGVVFVLGTRPNDILKPLKLLKPRQEYPLRNLTRLDFDLILEHRRVSLKVELADRFFDAMQENALFLDLVAKELKEESAARPDEIIQRVTHNPENIFSLSIARLRLQSTQWQEVIKPVLGLLLAARESLTLRHIRYILEVDDDQLREGLVRLGGLIVENGQQRYSLFHSKLQDYLRQDEHNPDKEYIFATDEEENWHNTLITWCERGGLSLIWEDVKSDPIEQRRREYARQHYITHLYHAHEWHRLFKVLDLSTYGRAKVNFDRSMHSYVQDLDLGRRVATSELWTDEESLQWLSHLWRYTLLRCSLVSRADNYSLTAFQALILLKRENQALDLAELLTKSDYKVNVLLLIARLLRKQPDSEQKSLQLLLRAHEVTRAIDESKVKARLLRELGHELDKVQQRERAATVWTEAQEAACSIQDGDCRTEALHELVRALVKVHWWEQAELVTSSIDESKTQVSVLRELGIELGKAEQWERATAVWTEAQEVACSIQDHWIRAGLLRELVDGLVQMRQWDRARVTARVIEDSWTRARVLRELGNELGKAEQWDRAELVWAEVEAIIQTIQDSKIKARALRELSKDLARAHQWDRAEELALSLKDKEQKSKALIELGSELARTQQWDRNEELLTKVEAVTRTIEDREQRAKILHELVGMLVHTQQWERAQMVWIEAETETLTIKDAWFRSQMLYELGDELIQMQQWDRAEALAHTLEDRKQRVQILRELGVELAKAGQWDRAQAVARTIGDSVCRAEILRELVRTLVKAGKWDRAASTAFTIEDRERRAEILHELVRELAGVREWDRAASIASAIEDRERRAEVLSELVIDLIRVQEWDRAKVIWAEAETVVYAVEDKWARAEVLQKLGNELAQLQHWKLAETMWRAAAIVVDAIESGDKRTRLSFEPAKEHIQFQQQELNDTVASTTEDSKLRVDNLRNLVLNKQWVRAEAIARTIEGKERRIEILRELVITLAEMQEWDHAESFAQLIEDKDCKAEVLHRLIIQLARAGQWETAEMAAHTIEDDWFRAWVLSGLSRRLVQAQDWIWAISIWEEVEATAHMIDDSEHRLGVLSGLGIELIQLRQWEKAEAIARTIEDNWLRATILHDLGRELAQAQQWDRAEKVAYTIEDKEYRAGVLSELGRRLAQAEQWDRAQAMWAEAEAIVHAIEDSRMRARGLSELGGELAQAQQWDRAEAIWEKAEIVTRTIKDTWFRAKVFHELVRHVAKAQKWDRAESIARTIEDNQTKARVLGWLGCELARAQQWDQAETMWEEAIVVAFTFEEIEDKMAVLYELATALAQFGKYKQLLPLVQRAWLQVDTRAHAINLLSLATGLIPFKPEIGTAFFEAFTWVDAFLKG